MNEEILYMDHVKVTCQKKLVLNNFTLRIFKGEIMGLIFADDLGKKQLIDILCDNLPIIHGQVYLDGQLINNYRINDQRKTKVYLIQESSSLIHDLTVADNIFVMRKSFKGRVINMKLLVNQTRRLMGEMHLDIDPRKRASALTVIERCIVELIKAEIAGCGLIILHELSNFLMKSELSQLHQVVDFYCKRGISFLYIDNYHQVFEASKRAALMWSGYVRKIFQKEEMNDMNIMPYHLPIDLPGTEAINIDSEILLEYHNIRSKHLNNLSFSIQKGECIVLYDQSNVSISDLKEIMINKSMIYEGSVHYGNEIYTRNHARTFLQHGIGIVDENPTQKMLFYHMTYLENLTYLVYEKLPGKFIRKKYLKSIAKEYKQIVGEEVYEQNMNHLSLASKYRLIYYRIQILNPNVLLCMNPLNWGDMHCKKVIQNLIQELKSRGMTIIILTNNFDDSLEVADRLLVLENGKISRQYQKKSFSHLLKREKKIDVCEKQEDE